MSYPAYPEYKDSGVEWLGEVPAHWILGSFRHLIKSLSNGTTANQVDQEENSIAVSRIETISKGKVDFSKVGYVRVCELDERFLLRPGDVLFSHINSLPMIGNAAVYEGEKPLLHGMNLLRIQPAASVESGWVLYWLKSKNIRQEVESRAKPAINQASISTASVKSLPALIPPQVEQRNITSFLEHETARIDALVEEQKRLIALLKEKRQAVISHAVTKGLDPNVPMKDSGVEWLGEVPKHWDVIGSKRFFRLVAEPAPKDNNFELLSVYTDIGVRPRKELEAKGNKASTTDGYWLVKQGDIVVNKLLAWMGAVGFSAYEGVTSPAYDILRPIRDMDSKFYHYLFRSKRAQQEFKRWSRGIMDMRLRLYFDELGRILVPFPPPEEQTQIVQYIENIEKKYDGLTDAASEQIKLLVERRSALISATVTGKIDVRGWKPPTDSVVSTEAKPMEAV